MAQKRRAEDDALPKSVFGFAWRYTKKQQIWVLGIVLISMIPYFLALDLPKRIVNGPIQGRGFTTEESTQPFLNFSFSAPDWLGGFGPYELFSGFDLDRLSSLYALSFTFLAFVIINGLFKFYINLYKGRLGERMLRRLRFELVDRVLRFPIPHFKRVKQSEVASMVKDEVEPIGGFVGEAFVTPVFLGGQAVTAMAFIMLQSFSLGLIAGGIVAVQAILIPRLRRRLIELGRQRQLTARNLAGKVGELVDGISAVHVNDTSNYERADIAARLGKIFSIRYELFQRKFFVKFLNNFLAQVTPFIFYLLGGYFALTGELDIGQLVAVIGAYKDLPAPIKDLINWDQLRLDVQVKYTQVVDQFHSDGMLDPKLQEVSFESVTPLSDGFKLSGLSVADDTGTKLVEMVSTQIALKDRIAVIGGTNSGGEALADVVARLMPETSGSIKLDQTDLEDLPEYKTGRRIGYVPPEVALFFGSLGDNLLYGLKHAPFREKQYEGEEYKRRQWEISEARQAGNTELDVNADWINYEAAGVTNEHEMIMRIMEVLKQVELSSDVMNFGLRGRIDPTKRADLAEKILAARAELGSRLEKAPYDEMVERFDPEVYTEQATVGENILFGTLVDGDQAQGQFYRHPHVQSLLAEAGLEEEIYEMGREMASTAVELFADLAPGHPFFAQLSFMSAEEMPDFQVALNRVKNVAFAEVGDDDKRLFSRLTFDYIEPRHRLGLLDDDKRARLLEVRKKLRDTLPEDLKAEIAFYDPASYNHIASVQDNILFGRIAYGVAEGEATILELVREVLDSHGLSDEVFTVGLEFDVGSGGKRLSSAQRQKLGMARALLKNPDFLIVNRALAALDRNSQGKIISQITQAATENGRDLGLFWVLANPEFAKSFDRVIIMEEGRLVEDGKPADLAGKSQLFDKLTA